MLTDLYRSSINIIVTCMEQYYPIKYDDPILESPYFDELVQQYAIERHSMHHQKALKNIRLYAFK